MTDPRSTRTAPGESWLSLGDFASACGEFAFSLYGQLRHEAGNLVCSPYCVSAALLMALAGARGRTRDEMAAVIGVGSEERNFRILYRNLSTKLQHSGCEWHSAARLWPQSGYPLLAEFVEAARAFAGEEPQPLDFARDPAGAADRINAWVAEATRGKIPHLIEASSISDLTRLSLTSAAYFKGSWREPFPSQQTREEDFKLGAKGSVRAQMMHQNCTLRGAATDGLKIVGLPYGGSPLAMVLVLPDATDGLPALEDRCDWHSFHGWMSKTVDREVILSLPRFAFASAMTLVPALSAMGMPAAFEMGRADFSGMAQEADVFLGEVRHRAAIEVAEEGTVAAAATYMEMEAAKLPGKAPPPPPPLEFRADHPFLFALVDREADLVLFVGRVENPLA